ncbi:ABC transporter substrate-binding protein [Deinococcus cellulosilyticus]|uniref:ABC transporter substrate-binding protein n=1 Tax=Deinococcus cellulosilyticus (strain DSM 18568 / NBRC 106333 / KACC 11606 / 5516J-15) TaxID=1223518 RepID=A0A511MY37_DEIC1|nr:sugar ABC transporter substrate-binding protein [Deinococcus cellulosilyticus]GEM45505.1 ABC transporter substrate-binding protein [Deinococcus cellulosilyticus NBRC 106333 = KACC 11606]
MKHARRNLMLLTLLSLSTASAQEKVTLRFTTWAGGDGLKLLQTLATEFTKKNPSINVEVESIPFASYDQKLTVQMAGGTSPDVGWVAERSAPAYMSSKSLVDLNPYIKSNSSMRISDYAPASMTLWKKGEGIYGLPFSFSPIFMYYNKDLFQKAGIPTPSELLAQKKWNYAAFEASAAAIKKAAPNAYGGTLLRLDPTNWAAGILAAMYSSGGDIFNKDLSSCTMNSAGTVQAFEMMQRMIKEGSAPKLGEQVTFASGNLGMYADQVSYSGQLSNVKFKWDIVPMPSGPKGQKTLLGQAGYAVFSGSKHQKEAIQFVAFLSSPAVMKRTAQFFPPPRRSILNSDAYLNSNPLIPAASLRQAVLKQVSGAKALIVPANWAQVNDVVVRNMDRIFRPSANVKDELNQVCNDINPLLR